jgi:hypothetical protein
LRPTHAAGSRERRLAIDVARVLALVIVVLGHLLIAVIDRRGGELRGANLLELHPGWAWIAALAPMPVFFGAAGWANATSTMETITERLRTLIGLGTVVATTWSGAVVAAVLANGTPGIIGDGARIATQPLWFLAAYLPLAAGGGRLARLSARNAPTVIGSGLVLLAALDAARFGFGAPDWVGWPGFFVAWGLPWLAGGWWRSRYEAAGFDERRAGLLIAVAAGLGCIALVAFLGYDFALIDAVPGDRSNTTPPTLYTGVAALAQVGLLVLGARVLDGVGRRFQRLVQRAGEAAVGIYLWHLTALALCAAVIAAGAPVPDRLTAWWWFTRPIWWLAVLTLTIGLVQLTALGRALLARRGGRGGRASSPPGPRVSLGIAAATAGAAVTGIEGPRSVGFAVVCSGLFVVGWLLLRPDRSSGE